MDNGQGREWTVMDKDGLLNGQWTMDDGRGTVMPQSSVVQGSWEWGAKCVGNGCRGRWFKK